MDWNTAVQQFFSALPGLISLVMAIVLVRELRPKTAMMTAQAGAAQMSATKDEFEIMDIAQKRQERIIEEQRTNIARMSGDMIRQDNAHVMALNAIKVDFQAKLDQRDTERAAERDEATAKIAALQEQTQTLEEDRRTSNSKIAALEKELAEAQEKLKNALAQLETERKETDKQIKALQGQVQTLTEELEEERRKNLSLTTHPPTVEPPPAEEKP